jgi:hypothetical protein
VTNSPTTAPPAWLEAAARLDALTGEKVPLSAARNPAPAVDVDDELETEAAVADVAPSEVASRPVNRLAVPAPETMPRPRIAVPIPKNGAAEETDLAWQGYSPAALLPSTIVLAVVTVSVIVLLRPLVPTWVLHEAADAPLAALWIFQAIRAAYRLLAYDYRLTTRRLFCGRGRLYPVDAPVELALVIRVAARQTPLGRLTGIGTVVINREDAPPMELVGVRQPKVLAAQIEEAATKARETNVVSARLQANTPVAHAPGSPT